MKTTAAVTGAFLILLLSFRGFAGYGEFTGGHNLFSGEGVVDFYPTYGYPDNDEWVIPMKLYVYEPRGYIERIMLSIFQRWRDFTPSESDVFISRFRVFAADSKSREVIEFRFDQDTGREKFTIRDPGGHPLRTDLNGIIEGEIRISKHRAAALLEVQDSRDNWLMFTVVSEHYTGKGEIRLISSSGTSVITDIDDTIKISEMPAGARIAVRNAFFKEYSPAPGMSELYKRWSDDPVHYVSGTPKQFYRPLADFMLSESGGFPKGTFHLRDVRKNFLSLNTWGDLEDIITAENVTFNHKFDEISQIIGHFPGRDFILVGDTGQHDPEIFRAIAGEFPGQVKEVIIRDITNDREDNPQRLTGMTVIPAQTVEYGISGIGDQ